MKIHPGYFKAGLFALGAMGVAMAFVVMLGGGAFLREGILYETYVDESVQGLDVGAPVKFRGVRVGEVKVIDFVQNDCDCHKHFIQLVCNVDTSAVGPRMRDQLTRGLAHEIAGGLRMGLAARGLTGGLYVEMDYFDPAQNPPLKIDWEPKNLYIPSMASTTSRLLGAAEKLMDRVAAVDLAETHAKVDRLLDEAAESAAKVKVAAAEAPEAIRGIRELVRGPLVEEIREAFAEIRGGAQAWRASAEAGLSRSMENVRRATEELPATVERMNRTIRQMEAMLTSQQQDMAEAVEGLRAVAEQMRGLVFEAERNASGLIFGGPPPKIEPGRRR
jgi:phospholipid/cholesterol/gamma-HCH transport system substrate-binding protein